jgi:hypothetical protein
MRKMTEIEKHLVQLKTEEIGRFNQHFADSFGEITISIGKCPRCGKEHKDLKLEPEFGFTRPNEELHETVFNVGAECPETKLFIKFTFWSDVRR